MTTLPRNLFQVKMSILNLAKIKEAREKMIEGEHRIDLVAESPNSTATDLTDEIENPRPNNITNHFEPNIAFLDYEVTT